MRWCCERSYVDINSCNNADYTALHESCAAGHADVASCLIQFGANVHAISQLDGARSVKATALSLFNVFRLCRTFSDRHGFWIMSLS